MTSQRTPDHPAPKSRDQLLANGCQQQPLRGTSREIDHVPVVKLFTPDAGATWLLTEIDSDESDIAFGLCDWGLVTPRSATSASPSFPRFVASSSSAPAAVSMRSQPRGTRMLV